MLLVRDAKTVGDEDMRLVAGHGKGEPERRDPFSERFADRNDVQLRANALADFDAGARASKAGFVEVAGTGLGFPIPADVEGDRHALHGVVNLVIGEVLETTVFHPGLQVVGEGLFAGDPRELLTSEDGRPTAGGRDLDVLAVVEPAIGEAGPMDEVDDVGSD